MIQFSDTTANLVLQLRCSAEILDSADVDTGNPFEENCRRLRDNFGVTNKDARRNLQKFMREANEQPIDAFYRLEKLLKNPSLGFTQMSEVCQYNWISDCLQKILPTDPYRHFLLLWRQENETPNLHIIRRLIKDTMEIYPAPGACNYVETDSDTAEVYAMDHQRRFHKKKFDNDNRAQKPSAEITALENRLSKLEKKQESIEKKQESIEEKLCTGFSDISKQLSAISNNHGSNQNNANYNNQNRNPNRGYKGNNQNRNNWQNRSNNSNSKPDRYPYHPCQKCINKGTAPIHAFHYPNQCPNKNQQ